MLLLTKCVLTLAIGCRFAFGQVGDTCVLEDGRDGICKAKIDCPDGVKKAEKGLSVKICGDYEYTKQIFCCEKDDSSLPIPNDNTFLGEYLDVDFEDRHSETTDGLRINEAKCREYSKAFSETVDVVPLLTDTKAISVPVAVCQYNTVPLIVNGERALLGEFPFMAVLGFDGRGPRWRCGGTLISDRFVLTAAHCTYAKNVGPPKVVRLGDLDLSTRNDGSEHKDYKISRIITHPDYKYPKKYNDIALVQTEETIIFTKFIRPVCLYSKSQLKNPVGIATGWGRTGINEDTSNVLQKVTLHLYNNQQCQRPYKNMKRELPHGITSTMLCAGELKGGKDTCYGDSGGPLLITERDNQCVFYIIGITSFGIRCAEPDTPAVYTRVSEYITWIEQHVWL